MIHAQVIARLVAQVPALKLVAGAAQFAALDAPPPLLPAAYVLPIASQAEPNSLAAGGFRQRVTEVFAVILLHRNLRDARGAAAVLDLADTLIPAVRTALIGWAPAAGWDALSLAQGRLIDTDDNVLAWRDDFVSATQLRAT